MSYHDIYKTTKESFGKAFGYRTIHQDGITGRSEMELPNLIPAVAIATRMNLETIGKAWMDRVYDYFNSLLYGGLDGSEITVRNRDEMERYFSVMRGCERPDNFEQNSGGIWLFNEKATALWWDSLSRLCILWDSIAEVYRRSDAELFGQWVIPAVEKAAEALGDAAGSLLEGAGEAAGKGFMAFLRGLGPLAILAVILIGRKLK